jgi:hypothetical protein
MRLWNLAETRENPGTDILYSAISIYDLWFYMVAFVLLSCFPPYLKIRAYILESLLHSGRCEQKHV